MLGPNGAGKSTLMNILVDGIKRTDGSIKYNGTEISKMGAKYRNIIGYVPPQQGMYETFTAEEFLNYIGNLKGINKKILKSKISEVMVSGLMSAANKTKIRFITDGNPEEGAVKVEPNLEDYYLIIEDENK